MTVYISELEVYLNGAYDDFPTAKQIRDAFAGIGVEIGDLWIDGEHEDDCELDHNSKS